LRQAIDNEEFQIYYQPQINTCTYTLIGLEALVPLTDLLHLRIKTDTNAP